MKNTSFHFNRLNGSVYLNNSISSRTLGFKRRQAKIFVGIMIFAVILIFGTFGCRSAYRSTSETVTATVLDKERVCKSTTEGSSCDYLIFTDKGTFRVSDTFGVLSNRTRFSTSDTYGQIKRDATYEFKLEGFRIPFFSQYKNIFDYHIVEE